MMIRILGTIFAGLLGLAFGSFLNVCLSRWPEDESVVEPRSHCRQCGRTLAWRENVPLVSWLALRGRCRSCRAWIGWRYPLVEFSVGLLWALAAWQALVLMQNLFAYNFSPLRWIEIDFLHFIGNLVFIWLLVALAFLDAEHLWLPDRLTIPGIVLGFLYSFGDYLLHHGFSFQQTDTTPSLFGTLVTQMLSILVAAGLILAIRWTYRLIRRREGIGLGDAKLMAMLAAWLGLSGALLSFGLGVLLGSMAGLALLAMRSGKLDTDYWAAKKLPLGTFLCIGGIVSSLWGERLIGIYRSWAGF
jgi:leader peptidase (prepilin peptidase)/N-methyltransferase